MAEQNDLCDGYGFAADHGIAVAGDADVGFANLHGGVLLGN
jgi:hypothetical protein